MKYSHDITIAKNRYPNVNRTVKQSGGSMHLHVDSEHTAGETATEGFSLYVGPWMTVNQDRRYTKHIYAGSQRIVSKVGDVSSFSSSTDDPRGVLYVGKDGATGVDSIGTRGRYAAQTARVGGLYAKFGVPYGGRDNNVYPDEVPEPAPENLPTSYGSRCASPTRPASTSPPPSAPPSPKRPAATPPASDHTALISVPCPFHHDITPSSDATRFHKRFREFITIDYGEDFVCFCRAFLLILWKFGINGYVSTVGSGVNAAENRSVDSSRG